MNIIPDISISISFSQTQGPNTGSASVTKKTDILKNESFYVNKVITLVNKNFGP